MGEACGKWLEVAACVLTSEVGLRTRWFTVMDTAATSPFTKVTLAAVSTDPAGQLRSVAARGAARSFGFPGSRTSATVYVRVSVCGRGREACVLFVVSTQHT